MLWLCFKLPSCLFGNTGNMSVMHKKAKIGLFYLYKTAKNEIQICSNKHETGLVCPGIPEGSTGSGSGLKTSQKTGQRLRVSSNLFMLMIHVSWIRLMSQFIISKASWSLISSSKLIPNGSWLVVLTIWAFQQLICG